jgi:hypothetical protein
MHRRKSKIPTGLLISSFLTLSFMSLPAAATDQFGTPNGDEGTCIFKATEHPRCSRQFHLSGQKATLIGGVNDRTP